MNVERVVAELSMVRLEDLHVDTDAQRMLNERRAAKMADAWNPLWAGAITVGRDPHDQMLYVCDGQTRCAAGRLAGQDEIMAAVFDGIDAQKRAEMFLHLNRDRVGVHRYDIYRIALKALDPPYLEVESILSERGLRAASSSSEKAIGGVGTLMEVFTRQGAEVLRSTLDVIQAAWPLEGGDRWQADLMAGLALVIARNLVSIEMDRLIATARKKMPGTWKALLIARVGGPGGSRGRPVVAATMFAEAYNVGLRGPTRKLKEHGGAK